jgi:hypothetical protein
MTAPLTAFEPGDRIAVPSIYGQFGLALGSVRETLDTGRVIVHLDGIGIGTWDAEDVIGIGDWRWLGRVKHGKACATCGARIRRDDAAWWHPKTKAMACAGLRCIR